MSFKLAKHHNHKNQLKKIDPCIYSVYIHACIFVHILLPDSVSLGNSGLIPSQLAFHISDSFSPPYTFLDLNLNFQWPHLIIFKLFYIDINPNIKIWMEFWRRLLSGRKITAVIQWNSILYFFVRDPNLGFFFPLRSTFWSRNPKHAFLW